MSLALKLSSPIINATCIVPRMAQGRWVAMVAPRRRKPGTLRNLSLSSSESCLLESSSSAAGDVCGFRVVPGFVTDSEEQSLLKEVTRALKRRRYQYDHWDGVS